MADQGISRSDILRRGAVVSGLAAASLTFGVGLTDDADSAPSPATDERIFRYLLGLEQLQAALYTKAVEDGALSGEVSEYAKTVHEHERQHVDFLTDRLDGKVPKPDTYDFGDATSGNVKFLDVAVDLEETGLSAYNGAAAQVSPSALGDLARILSVEARHASWARDLTGLRPAPGASDRARSQQQVLALVKQTGYGTTP